MIGRRNSGSMLSSVKAQCLSGLLTEDTIVARRHVSGHAIDDISCYERS